MTTIMRPDDVRRRNRRRIIAAIRRNGPASRTGIGRTTGLSAATISAITSNLIEEGVLASPGKGANAATGRGRPEVALAVNPNAALVGTMILQLNSISAAIINYAGMTVAECKVEISTTASSLDEIRNGLAGCLKSALVSAGGDSGALKRITVGIQGVTDIEGAVMLWSPIIRQRDIPIRVWLEQDFGAPANIANDCDMMAQALNWREPEKYSDNFAAVQLGHGVGMGLFLRGALVNGTQSSGTEFGHMVYKPHGALCRCGNRGCIEAYAGDYALARHIRGLPGDAAPPGLSNTPDIAAYAAEARNGNAVARAAFEAAGAAIGTGLASLYALVDAFPVVLLGRNTVGFDLMERSLRGALSGTIVGHAAENIHIECFEDERPFVREGCAITALLVQDDEIAEHRLGSEAYP